MSTALIQPQAVAPERPVAAGTVDAVKVHGHGESAVHALDGVTIDFRRGRMTAIMGPSGSGKSTLMHCVAGLDSLTAGRAFIGGVVLQELDQQQLTKLRRDHVGFVFQSFNLIPTLTAAENITLPLSLAGRRADPARFDELVQRIGLQDRLRHRPSELSGGQQQRVAIARALIGRPDIVFADEPTGNLDSRASAEILALLRAAVDEFDQTIVMVTHDPGAACVADRVVYLADGRIAGETDTPTVTAILDHMRELGGEH